MQGHANMHGGQTTSSPLFNLVDLNLAGNNLGENGVQLIASALQERHKDKATALEKLDLTNTNCGTQGAIDIIAKGHLKGTRSSMSRPLGMIAMKR